MRMIQEVLLAPKDSGGAPAPKPAPKLNPVPFVADGFTFDQNPRIWKTKPSAKTPAPTRVGVNLGSFTLRIAGSAVSFSVPVGIAFENAGADPTPRINVPTDDQYIPQPLFKSDSPADAADLDRFIASAGSDFFAWYTTNHADKIPLATVDHKYLADRVGSSASAPVKIR